MFCRLLLAFFFLQNMPKTIKLFFMLNSTEHEISTQCCKIDLHAFKLSDIVFNHANVKMPVLEFYIALPLITMFRPSKAQTSLLCYRE